MPDTTSTNARRPLSLRARFLLGLAIAAATAFYVVMSRLGLPPADWGYQAASTTAVVVAAIGYRRNRPAANPAVWRWLLCGLVLYTLGDWLWYACYTLCGQVPDVSVPDIGYVTSSLCLGVGGLRFARRRLGASNIDGFIDAASLAAALVLVIWDPVIMPAYAGAPLADKLVLGTYPAVDVVMVAVLIRFAVFGRARSGVSALAFAASAVFLVADSAYAVAIRHGWYDTGAVWLDAIFLVAMGLWGLAFCHPSLPTAAAPVPMATERITNGRLVLSAAALTVAPVTAAVSIVLGQRPNAALFIGSSLVGSAAVLWRLRRLVGAVVQSKAETDRQRAYFADLVEHAGDATLVVDGEGRIVAALGSTGELYGRSHDQMVGMTAPELIHADDLDHVGEALTDLVANRVQVVATECRIVQQDGSIRWVTARVSNRLAGSPVGGIVVNVSDITARKQAEQALAHQALHDGLTGLANRALLEDRLSRALARRHGGVGLLYLDLDRFKVVNDSLGHGAGDQLLVAVAERITAQMRPTDTVARLGGDEFCLVVEHDDADADALAALLGEIGERILVELRRPVTLDGVAVVVGASIGLVVANPADTAAALLRHGDLALYAAKNSGKGRVVAYDEAMQEAATERLTLEADLRAALDAGEIDVHYQPIVELSSGELIGFEALARWTHRSRGAVSPERFIPIAEESNLIMPLGRSVLNEACQSAAGWARLRAEGGPVLVTVNVSAVQLADAGFVADVAAALESSGLPATSLILELTEGALVADPHRNACRLEELKALGVRIAVDDFGVGHSSIGYLGSFPIDVVKLDRSFLSNSDAGKLAPLAQGLLDLGTTMGFITVAEGVELEGHRQPLVASGCQYGQGWLFARPLTGTAAADLVADARSLTSGITSQAA